MSSNDFFTIVICSYNSEAYIETCLESLLLSPYSPQVIVVDDGSTDDSRRIIDSYTKRLPKMKIISNETNRGLIYSCNRALEEVKTPFYMRLDADDFLSEDAFQMIEESCERYPDKDFLIFSRWDYFPQENKKEKVIVDASNIYDWISSGVLFRLEKVLSVGGYSDEYWEEYDLYIKLLEAGARYEVIPRFLYNYRRLHGSMTENKEACQDGVETMIAKWGRETLFKYGNFEQVLTYYGNSFERNEEHARR